MPYLLDANVLITAHRQWYGFDFCPAFWDWIRRAHAAGDVFSVARVEAELAGDDELATWVRDLPAGFFLRESGDDAAADFALVAQALARKLSVVTLEVRSGSQRIIKIPDACAALNVSYLTPYAMLKRERARFVLAPTPTSRSGTP